MFFQKATEIFWEIEEVGLEKQNVLMFERTMSVGGSSKVVLQLCQVLKPYVNNIVVCSAGGENVAFLEELGIIHITIVVN